jgi:hypothetical protein
MHSGCQDEWSPELTNIVQVQALSIVARESLEEGIAVLCGAIARLHRLACIFAIAARTALSERNPEQHSVQLSVHAHMCFTRHAGLGRTFPRLPVHDLYALPGICDVLVCDVCTAGWPVLGRRCAIRA